MDVVEWLSDSDPAIRWQVMRDLTDAPGDHVAAERARVAGEGWGARLLALQHQDGQWDGGIPTFTSTAAANWWQSMPPERQGTLFPQWTSTTWSLSLLRAFGLDPAGAGARRPSAWSASTADGSTTASPSSRARWSRASTAEPWRSGPTSARTSSPSSPGFSASR